MANTSRVIGYKVKANNVGGSFRTGKVKISVDPARVLKRFYFERAEQPFRRRVARYIQDIVFKPLVAEAYSEFVRNGLPAALAFQMSGASDFSADMQFGSSIGNIRVKHQRWMSHSRKYRKHYRGNGNFRSRTGGHTPRIINKLSNLAGLRGRFVVSNNLKSDYKTMGGKLKVDVGVRITHKLGRKDYDNMVKLAFFEGQVHRKGLIYSYGGDRDIGILNAFETGYGGRGGRYSRRRHRPIIGETARAYGVAMRKTLRNRMKSFR